MSKGEFELDAEMEVEMISKKIQRYLHDKHNAADTLEGLVQWWLIRQSIAEETKKVKLAVEQLVAAGKVNIRKLPDGTELYINVSNDI